MFECALVVLGIIIIVRRIGFGLLNNDHQTYMSHSGWNGCSEHGWHGGWPWSGGMVLFKDTFQQSFTFT